jgi:hypothetical protein
MRAYHYLNFIPAVLGDMPVEQEDRDVRDTHCNPLLLQASAPDRAAPSRATRRLSLSKPASFDRLRTLDTGEPYKTE